MIKVTWHPTDGIVVADGRAEMLVNEWSIHNDVAAVISSHLILYWLRIYVKAGVIKPSEVQIHYKDQIISLDKFGQTDHWPKGFADDIDQVLWLLATPQEEWDKKLYTDPPRFIGVTR